MDEALDRGVAVHATIDWASLPLSGAPAMWAGGMPRQANVVGRDDGGYVLDVGAALRLEPAQLARVRGAAKKEKHRAFVFAAGAAEGDPVAATSAAVQGTAHAMVEAPFRNFASNFGLAALEKQALLCVDAKDQRGWPRVFGSGPLAARALWRTWECVTLELTAPAGSRTLYAEFLEESARLPGLAQLAEAAALAHDSAELFAKLADDIVATTPEVAAAVTISEEVEELLGLAARSVPPGLLWVNPDCGLKTRRYEEVEPSLRNLVTAAHRARQRHPANEKGSSGLG